MILVWAVLSSLVAGLLFGLAMAVTGMPMDIAAAEGTAEAPAQGHWLMQVAGTLLSLVLFGLGAAVVAVGYHDLRIAGVGEGVDSMPHAPN